jgi:hypothetical protein
VSYTPLAVLLGALVGLLIRSHHAEIDRVFAPGAQVVATPSPLAAAPEGWRWLFTEDEWRGPAGAIGKYKDGVLEFHGSTGKLQTESDGAIRAQVIMRGPAPQPVSVFLRGTGSGQIRWVLDPAQRNARLLYEVNGQEQEVGKYRLAKPLAPGDHVLLELRAKGGDVAGFLNGAEVVRAHDPRGAVTGLWGVAGDGVWLEKVEVSDSQSAKEIARAAPSVPASPAEKATPPELATAPVPPAADSPKAPAVAAVPASPATTPVPESPATTPAPEVAMAKPSAPLAPAPGSGSPAAATPAPGVDTATWLASLDTGWRATYQRDIAGPFEKGAVELRRQHYVAMERPLATATKAGRPDEAAAWAAERDLVSKGSNPPATDDDTTPGALKLLRANFRSQFARLDKERFERARVLFGKCDDVLARTQAALTQRQRADDAATVQKERDQLRSEWLQPPSAVASKLPPMTKAAATPGKISSQQIVAKLMELGAGVWVKKGKTGEVEIKAESEVDADDKLIFTRVDFRGQKRDQSKLAASDYDILDSITEVQELTLAGTAVKDSVMEKLRAFHGLHSLSLERATPSPPGYAVLPSLPELRSLRLNGTEANDEAMKPVMQCHKLQHLTLADLPIGDNGMADIGKLTALEDLQIVQMDKLGSPAFAHLVQCKALKNVHLSGSIILSGMVENLSHCKTIETLSISGSGLKDPELAPLGGLTKLRSLDLNGSKATGAAFASWPQRAELTNLNLSNTGGVDDAGCKTIEHTFPKLQDLTVSLAAKGFSSEGASALARLRTLRTLRMTGPGIDDDVVAELAHRDSITTLGIPSAQLSEAGIASLAHFAHLANLSFDFPPLTDAAMKSFSKCKELKTLTISADADPQTEGKFMKSAPGVKIVRPGE